VHQFRFGRTRVSLHEFVSNLKRLDWLPFVRDPAVLKDLLWKLEKKMDVIPPHFDS
jgi:hypothetical protein